VHGPGPTDLRAHPKPLPMTAPSNPASAADARLSPALDELLERFGTGNRSALARAISLVENERPGFQTFLHRVLGSRPPSGARIGLTGPPGAGKSSLVTALAGLCRERDEEVGIVAVDPTSPYSGGALLGDRIRMNELATDPGIFIRSMASRGSLGGLATTTKEVLDLMDAFGFPRILIETVGVGQAELEITGAADTVVVVLVPESGDGIQAMKAGLMEIADIFVVNKADRPGADRMVREVRTALNLGSGRGLRDVPAHHGVDLREVARGGRPDRPSDPGADGAPAAAGPEPWIPPIVTTTAHAGEGVEELLDEVDRHRVWLAGSGELEQRRRRRTADRIRDVLERELKRRVRGLMADEAVTAGVLERIVSGAATPYSVAGELLERFGPEDASPP
jgi:LAO/AO transport system kinase